MKRFAFLILIFISFVLFGGNNGTCETGVTDSEILIGSSLALEGHASYLGIQTLHGAMAYIKYVNENGGVNGRKISIISYNDGYDPPICVKNTRKLIEKDKVFALFCYVGTPTSVKIIPMVEKAKIPLVGLFTGAEALRTPVKHYIFNIRASYYDETGGIIQKFWEELGLRKIAVFYQDDAFGQAGLSGVKIALKKYGSKPVALGTYKRGTNDIAKALEAIRKAGPDGVVMIGVYGPCSNFIRSAKWSGFSPYFHNVSFVGAKELAHLLGVGRDSEGVIVTQVVPPPDSDFPVTNEYRGLLKKYFSGDDPNFVSLEGFINAKVLVKILEKTGKDLTRDKFIAAAETLSYDPGIGSEIKFSHDSHKGLNNIYFTMIKKGKYHIIKDWKSIKRY